MLGGETATRRVEGGGGCERPLGLEARDLRGVRARELVADSRHDVRPRSNSGLAFHASRDAASAQSENERKCRGSSASRRSRAEPNPGAALALSVMNACHLVMNSSSLPACTCQLPDAY